MSTGLIITGSALGLAIIIYIVVSLIIKSRKKEYHDWEIDDLLIVNPDILANRKLELVNGYKYAKLKGWNDAHLYIDVGAGMVHQVYWDVIEMNKSAFWRRNYNECEKAMGKKPAFSSEVKHDTSTISGKIDGKPIELLNETECQVYLTQAIAEENYELGERITKKNVKI